MKQFWQEVLRLPYKSNSQDNPLHEQQVQDLLDEFGYTYVYQPNGSQASPDFRVTLPNGRVVDIECKSSNNTHPTYNGGLPKKGVAYIFSSNKYNETTIFFADDIITDRKRELYAQLLEDLNAVLKTYQLDEEWQDDERGFDFYIKSMYIQTGKGKKDYFKHPDRSRCESNVLNFDW
jgi:NADPH:quinone reductase-like Zn-dependent oxidoreductase